MKKYATLESYIVTRGYKRCVIAKKLHITERCLFNKILGKSPFTWEQACILHDEFFPDVSKDVLFEIKFNNKPA